MIRKASMLLLVVALALAFAGTAAPTPTRAADALKIGLLSDQSGVLKEYGKELEHGFALGLKYATDGKMEVAGRKIEVTVRDTASKPDIGSSLARELVEKGGAEILVGTPASAVALAVQQVAKDLDVPLFAGPSASANITGKNFTMNTVRVCRNGAQDYLALATSLKSSGITKVVVLAVDTDFGRTGAANAEASFKPYGIEMMKPIFAPADTTDFTPYLQQVLSSGANGLQITWAGDTGVALYKQVAELGVLKKLTLIAAFDANPLLKAAASNIPIGGVGFIVYHYTLPKTKINDWLVENNKKDYNGEVPDLFTECGFATAQALVAALNKTNGDASTKALMPAIEGLSFDGPRGKYWIRPADHQVLLPVYIVRLTNLTDPDFKFFELVAEVPADKVAPPCLLEGDFAARCKDAKLTTIPDAMMSGMATPAATPAK